MICYNYLVTVVSVTALVESFTILVESTLVESVVVDVGVAPVPQDAKVTVTAIANKNTIFFICLCFN